MIQLSIKEPHIKNRRLAYFNIYNSDLCDTYRQFVELCCQFPDYSRRLQQLLWERSAYVLNIAEAISGIRNKYKYKRVNSSQWTSWLFVTEILQAGDDGNYSFEFPH